MLWVTGCALGMASLLRHGVKRYNMLEGLIVRWFGGGGGGGYHAMTCYTQHSRLRLHLHLRFTSKSMFAVARLLLLLHLHLRSACPPPPSHLTSSVYSPDIRYRYKHLVKPRTQFESRLE